MPFSQDRDPQNKDETVSQPSYVLHGNSHIWKCGLWMLIECLLNAYWNGTQPRMVHCTPVFNITVLSIAAAEYHYDDIIMGVIASQITSLTIVYSTVYSDADRRKHQSSAALAFVWGIHRDRWIPRTKGQLRGKCFHLMTSSWILFRMCSVWWPSNTYWQQTPGCF